MDKIQSLMPHVVNVMLYNDAEITTSECPNHDILKSGAFLCKRCGTVLFNSKSYLETQARVSSFDACVAKNVMHQVRADGDDIDAVCSECHSYLGYILNNKDIEQNSCKYFINECTIDFCCDNNVLQTEEIIVAGGCFWGVDFAMSKLPGIVLTESGYIGGNCHFPNYDLVCTGITNHVEAVRIIFDVNKLRLVDVIKYFFEIHDPSQKNGQKSDIGSQYLSKIFYHNDAQKKIIDSVIEHLINDGLDIYTTVKKASIFWPAEDYHQNFYAKDNAKIFSQANFKNV